jgi:hypothetical protein
LLKEGWALSIGYRFKEAYLAKGRKLVDVIVDELVIEPIRL